ncbi:hypothetical protein V5P93_003625 [Actinokineospora auranticolor]|uniref:Secreted protein n=1 Tax=Actinokineospora auranticolor TaxID=155976 RepID=A0A2S6GIX2_9PSEU|nr:hypothetical protein [Actinokineospora auranticolor]PPK65188.1 hypothetical protein CLV40_11535 [Actinokineospora auranticolor]
MRMRVPTAVVTVGVLALVGVTATATAAEAKDRPCGQAARAQGVGGNGTPWTLKSMYDDDGPVPGALVVGEEFEIATRGAGQHWTVTFTDNDVVFFTNPDDVSTPTGLREVHMTPAARNTVEHMRAHAVRHDTGEVIDGTVVLPPAPARCGNRGA